MSEKNKFKIVRKEMISVLTNDLHEKIKGMRMRHALWESGCLLNNSDHGPLGAPYLMPRVPLARGRVYTGAREAGSYNHHSQLVKFQGKYWYAFSNGFIDEEAPGQRVAVSSSADGLRWSPAQTAVAANKKAGEIKNAVGLYASGKEITLYCWSEVAIRDAKVPGMRRIEAKSARIDSYVSRDGLKWNLKEKGIITAGESQAMMFEAPRMTKAGTLLTCGSQNGPVAYRWKASDPAGKPQVVQVPTPSSEACFPYGETSWYQTERGLIVMFWRDEGGSERLYVNFSEDDGRSWTPPVITDFPDSMSRVRAGTLPDGRHYLIGNSYPKLLDRMHLMMSLSDDGYRFNKMYALLEDPTAQRTKGLLKCHGYQYPCSLVDGDKLLVSYSVNKEDMECGIINISDL